jgi:hypothetical protein
MAASLSHCAAARGLVLSVRPRAARAGLAGRFASVGVGEAWRMFHNTRVPNVIGCLLRNPRPGLKVRWVTL